MTGKRIGERRPWTEADEAILRARWPTNDSIWEIARDLHRSMPAVGMRASALGLRRPVLPRRRETWPPVAAPGEASSLVTSVSPADATRLSSGAPPADTTFDDAPLRARRLPDEVAALRRQVRVQRKVVRQMCIMLAAECLPDVARPEALAALGMTDDEYAAALALATTDGRNECRRAPAHEEHRDGR